MFETVVGQNDLIIKKHENYVKFFDFLKTNFLLQL